MWIHDREELNGEAVPAQLEELVQDERLGQAREALDQDDDSLRPGVACSRHRDSPALTIDDVSAVPARRPGVSSPAANAPIDPATEARRSTRSHRPSRCGTAAASDPRARSTIRIT